MRSVLGCSGLAMLLAAASGCGGGRDGGVAIDGGRTIEDGWSPEGGPRTYPCGSGACTSGQVCCVGCDGTAACYGGDSCPGFMCPMDGGPEEAGMPDAGPGDAGGAPDVGTILCGTGEPVFPDYGSGCEMTADCDIGLHQIDCCGTMLAMGILDRERTAFEAAEATCAAMYPLCGCAARPTMAEDGRSASGGTIAIACLDGECRTFVP